MQNRRLIILTFIMFFIPFLTAFPQFQQYKFDHISTEKGLVSSTVNAIIQDRQGFLWFGTEEGLSRYDGYSFKNYTHSSENSNSLPHNFIWSLSEDKNGNIWIGTDGGGLSKFNPSLEKFTTYQNNPEDSASLSSNNVQNVFVDSENNVWVGTWEGGLNLYDREKNNFQNFVYDSSDASSLSNNKIFFIFEDKNKNLLICTDGGGVNVLNKQEKSFKKFEDFFNSNNKPAGNKILCMYEDSNGIYWFGMYGNGLDKFDPSTKTFTNFNPDSKNFVNDYYIWSIREDLRGNLWAGTLSNGINILEKGSGKFIEVRNNSYDPSSLKVDYIRTMFEDNCGVMWIGTMAGGLNKIDRKPQKFFNIKHQLNNSNTLSENFIFAINEDHEGKLWIGTYANGIDVYDFTSNTFTNFKSNPEIKSALNGDLVRNIFKDSDGDLWIGTYFGDFHKYDKKNNSFIRYNSKTHPETKGTLQNVRIIFEDSEGYLWIGTNGGGILKFDKKTDKFILYSSKTNPPYKLNSDYIISIMEDNDGNLWIGTYGDGINKFIKKEERFVTYKNDPKDKNSLSDNIVIHIHRDSKGDLWIGTYSGGLNKYEKKLDNFIVYNTGSGFASNLVSTIIEDDQGNLWLSSSKGITMFNNEKNTIKNYDYSDGVLATEFNPGAGAKLKNGWIYFGGVNGITAFNPETVYDNEIPPPVVITSIKLFNKEVESEKSPSFIDTLYFSYDAYNFSFEFASLDYTFPEKNLYKYMLEGIDKDWNIAGNRRFANYTNLDPGNYIFKVLGTNNNGKWSLQPAQVFVIISPPFWATWWFRIIAIGLLLGAVTFIYKRRIATLQKEKLAQEEFSRRLINSQEIERKRIASELHDGLGQDLLIIKNRALMGLKKDDNAFLIEQLNEISNTATNTINEVRQIAYNLHPYQLERLGLTKAIRSIITNLKDYTQIKISASIEEIDNLFTKEEEINIYRIVQENINNIIKHSGSEMAEIEIYKSDGNLFIKISDNGAGFELNKVIIQDAGFGMKNISKRVQFLKGKLLIESFPGKGCKVNIKIPLEK
jgi:signal transduction histidine kinase/ligand-binding sensor domain-containing protein